MTQKQPIDVVCLAIPRREQMAKVVRLATAVIASKTGLNLDQADDINTALDELFRLFLTDLNNSYPEFSLAYKIYPDKLEIVTQGVNQDFSDESNKISRYGRFILEKVADQVISKPDSQGGYEVAIIKYLSTN